MIGMMMMTFILFFAFVVNTGMLVNAKINLQNAADLAAYSGAATQARQLTQISYLNYEMRRQFKKFLFRYYVIGNMAQKSFPKGAGASGPPQWSPDGQLAFFGVPAVCITFSTTGPLDDYCQVAKLSQIQIPATNAATALLDAINTTLIGQLTAIEQIRQNNCGKIAEANTSVLLLWLFNTDPDLSTLAQTVNDPTGDQNKILEISRSVAYGLGLVPRELILNSRISTLSSYVNAAPQTGVSINQINTLEGGADPVANERTIQAFLSAFYTLGQYTFQDTNSIQMDELLPGGGQSNLLQLKPITQDFDSYSVQYVLTARNAVTKAADCSPSLVPIAVRAVPIGVSKDPTVLTYYAVRLKATAKVMFSPFGDMQLKAYAAARPFGSRIGPPLGINPFGYPGTAAAQYLDPVVAQQSNLTGTLPNLPITVGDTPAPGHGWDDNAVLGELYGQFFPPGVSGNSAEIDMQSFLTASRSAMVPNPIEGNTYNIMNDQTADPFLKNFDNLHQASFWAPVVPPSQVSNLQGKFTEELQALFTANPTNAVTGTNTNPLQAAILAGVIKYVGLLQAGQGEVVAGQTAGGVGNLCSPGACIQEGMNIVHIQDPFVSQTLQPIQLPSSIMMSDPKAFKTSYVSELDSNITTLGRVGYSVKFVSFDSLMSGTLTNGSTTAKANGFLDSEGQQDVNSIKH
jgi:hypothetical protein